MNSPTTYDKTVVSLEHIILRGLKSIRREHFNNRKALAKRLGLPVTVIINFERRHRRLLAAELFVLSFALNRNPEWVVHEILRRYETEIAQWRRESGF
jgi:hypothetical protein